jgi:hypothetical protein
MRPAGALRRVRAALLLALTAAVGTAGCVLAPFPEPVVVGPPVVVAPRPVFVAPHRHYYRGGWHRGGHGHHRHWH